MSDKGYYEIALRVEDNSGCLSNSDTAILNLNVMKGCEVKAAPVLNNLSSSYTIPRNQEWLYQINATDVDEEDSLTFSVVEVNHTSFSAFGSAMVYNATTGLLNITPSLEHGGVHTLNISVFDNSSCINKSDWQLVNITVDPTNTVPYYIGPPGGLDYTWNEDNPIYSVYDLDDYFTDDENDCLTYRFEIVSCSMAFDDTCEEIVEVLYEGVDPRVTCYRKGHFVNLLPQANDFGEFSGFFYANDTINESEGVFALFTVNNVPEPILVPQEPPAAGGGGGGGGGGPSLIPRCEEKWYCDPWGDCVEGYAARNCTDINECGTTKFLPNVTKPCVPVDHCSNGIQDYLLLA
jgi:hypothetical protein